MNKNLKISIYVIVSILVFTSLITISTVVETKNVSKFHKFNKQKLSTINSKFSSYQHAIEELHSTDEQIIQSIELEKSSLKDYSQKHPFFLKRLIIIGDLPNELYKPNSIINICENTHYLSYSTYAKTKKAYTYLKKQPNITVLTDHIMAETSVEPSYFSNDSYYSSNEWGYKYFNFDISQQIASQSNFIHNDVVVAVLDTGISLTHPALKNRLLPFYNASTLSTKQGTIRDGHGTHVSGIIVNSTPDNVKILPINVFTYDRLSNELYCLTSTMLIGINYAREAGASIINMSLGGDDIYSNQELRVLEKTYNEGIIMVAAAGNESDDVSKVSPANSDYTIAVSALDSKEEFDDRYSNYGDKIDFIAPGTNIYSTYYDTTLKRDTYKSSSGTSMATPFISSVFSYIKMIHPDWSVSSCVYAVKTISKDLFTPGKDIYAGYGAPTTAYKLFDFYADMDEETLKKEMPEETMIPHPTALPADTPIPTIYPIDIPVFTNAPIDSWNFTPVPTTTSTTAPTPDVIPSNQSVLDSTINKPSRICVTSIKRKSLYKIQFNIKKNTNTKYIQIKYSNKKSMNHSKILKINLDYSR